MNPKSLKKVRRRLLRNPTIWEAMFRKKLFKWKIKHQFQGVVKGFLPDFIIGDYDLIVEIDGKQHYTPSGILRDKFRDSILNQAGYKVLHIRNTEVADYALEDLLAFAAPVNEHRDTIFFQNYLASLR